MKHNHPPPTVVEPLMPLDMWLEVMSRTIVKDVNSDGGAGAGTGKKDPSRGDVLGGVGITA